MNHPELLIIIWIIIVLIIWRYVRVKKPGLIGLGKNPNKQKLDRVKYNPCPNCKDGYLEPMFRWWQYTFLISTPIGFLVFGKPLEFNCSNCSFKLDNSHKRDFLTMLSLSHKLSPPFYIGISVNLVFGLLVAFVFMKYMKI